MTDFEDRVRSALRAGAQEAPLAGGLVAGARARRARRRRTTLAAVAVAVVLVAVPVSVASLGGEGVSPLPGGPAGGPSGPPTKAVDPASEVPNGWRVESWRDVQVLVPSTWGHGSLSSWCISGDQPGTVVDRSEGVTAAVACTPGSAYGVQFLDPDVSETPWGQEPTAYRADQGEPLYPEGAYVGDVQVTHDVAVRVVSRDLFVARFLLDSARRIQGEDPNGCEPTADLSAPRGEPVLDGLGLPDDGAVSLCRFAVDAGPDGEDLLTQSELLTGPDASSALAALQATRVARQASVACAKQVTADAVLVRVGRAELWVNYGATCVELGVLDGDQVRELTSEVMFWVLTPGWNGAVEGDVPLPRQLRRPRP